MQLFASILFIVTTVFDFVGFYLYIKNGDTKDFDISLEWSCKIIDWYYDYATITINNYDDRGNPIEVKPEEIELIQEVTEDEHWQDVKERAAIAAMQGILANPERVTAISNNRLNVERKAVVYAETLVKELKS